MIDIKKNCIAILIFFISIYLLSACAQKPQRFSGESENWRILYDVENNNDYRESTGSIRYIGTSPLPKEIKYTLHRSSGNGPLEEGGVYTLPHTKNECAGCTSASEDEKFEAIIEWDNQTESLTLMGN